MIIYLLSLVLIFIIIFVLFSKEGYINNIVSIPKVIYTYWNDDIPDIVEKCLDSWKKFNPEYEIVLINKDNYKKYCDIEDLKTLKHNDSFARESDFIRLAILSKHGGVWLDASVICLAPLQEFKGSYTFHGYYCSCYSDKTNENFPIIESWFFACSKNCPFVKAWKDEFFSINKFNTIDDYTEYVKKAGVIVDGIRPDLQNYFAIYLASQKILQENYPFKKNMSLLNAEEGPYKYLSKNNWHSEDSIKWLCENLIDNGPLIKLRSSERDLLEVNKKYISCIFN